MKRVNCIGILLLLVGSVPAWAKPVVSPGGVTNGASFAIPEFPNGAIALGSMFTVFGSGFVDLGPPDAFPLPLERGGVSIQVKQGGTVVGAIPLFSNSGQMNAIMPSNLQPGEAELTVTVNGQPSDPMTIRIVKNSFAAFSPKPTIVRLSPGTVFNFVAQGNEPANSAMITAQPGQVVTVWGTGLGPLGFADNLMPIEGAGGDVTQLDFRGKMVLEIEVGGVPVTEILYAGRSPGLAGLDQISFRVPATAPLGCWVPVIIKAGAVTSPTFTMSIGANAGQACSDPLNPLSPYITGGGSFGTLLMVRAKGAIALVPGLPASEFTWDIFAGNFVSRTPDPWVHHILMSLPPVGSCSTAQLSNFDVIGILGAGLPEINLGSELDAGPGITITQNGSRVVEVPREDNRYVDTVGGGLVGGTDPLFDPASFNISSPGGPAVGPFSVDLMIPETVTWANPDELQVVNRSGGATFKWTGGTADQVVVLAAASLDLKALTAAAVYCVVPSQPGSFTVSPTVLQSLPPSGESSLSGFVVLGTIPAANIAQFVDTDKKLDAGVVMPVIVELRTGSIQ